MRHAFISSDEQHVSEGRAYKKPSQDFGGYRAAILGTPKDLMIILAKADQLKTLYKKEPMGDGAKSVTVIRQFLHIHAPLLGSGACV
jgi:hypothetical protein